MGMKKDLALKILSSVMSWDNDKARAEFSRLSLLARMKYDGYRGYVAGARFLESLAYWLQQFDLSERTVAYDFVMANLIYVGPDELQHLVELTYPAHIQPALCADVATRLAIQRHLIWADANASADYKTILRKTIFLGLSDGARIDAFRRANEGLILNEQIATTLEIDESRWESLLKKLRKDLSDEAARFEFVFLLDDFMGSGTTLLREQDGAWDGKLVRFWEVQKRHAAALAPNYKLFVHHYVASHDAANNARALEQRARASHEGWMATVDFSFGCILPKAAHHTAASAGDFAKLIEKYYDPSVETPSMRVGGENARYGFARSGLTLILEHNTPNNSLALLWAEADGKAPATPMRPLFRRRQRHF